MSWSDSNYSLYTIGFVKKVQGPFNESSFLEIIPPYAEGLKGLDEFSHVIVVWWAGGDNSTQTNTLTIRPPYMQGRKIGVFASRAPFRPNCIAITTCELLAVNQEEGFVQLRGIDAADGSRILDIKPYIPVCDRVKDVEVAEWIPEEWREWWKLEES